MGGILLLRRSCTMPMVAVVLFAAAFFVVSNAVAQPQTCKRREMASFDVTTSTDGWALIPVHLGNATLQFAINPAETFSLLTEAAANGQQLKLVTLERFDRFRYVGLAKYSAEAPLMIDRALAKGTQFGIVTRPIGNDPRVAGILGLDVLSAFDVELDLGHSKVNLFLKNHCPEKVAYWAPDLKIQPVKLDPSGWFKVPVQVNGHAVEAAISLVSDGMYVNPHNAMETFGTEVHAQDIPESADLLHHASVIQPLMPQGRAMPVVPLGIKEVVVAGVTITDPSTRVFDCDDVTYSSKRIVCASLAPLELGISELRKLRLYLDFQEGLLFVTAADAT